MKYAVIQCSNGSFSVVSEWTDKEKAFANLHTVCTNLYSAPDVVKATVIVVDEEFTIQKIERIKYNS